MLLVLVYWTLLNVKSFIWWDRFNLEEDNLPNFMDKKALVLVDL